MIRKRAKGLMDCGVTQKAIAASMGMSTATFSRWVNEAENVKITTDALDGFYDYEHELRRLLGPEPDHARAATATDTSPPASGPRAHAGEDRRAGKERRQAG